jgi:hypothetical protein
MNRTDRRQTFRRSPTCSRRSEGGKLLTRFIARDQRAKLVELEQQVREHIAVIDHFYAVLGPRNWMRAVRLRRGRFPGSGVVHMG